MVHLWHVYFLIEKEFNEGQKAKEIRRHSVAGWINAHDRDQFTASRLLGAPHGPKQLSKMDKVAALYFEAYFEQDPSRAKKTEMPVRLDLSPFDEDQFIYLAVNLHYAEFFRTLDLKGHLMSFMEMQRALEYIVPNPTVSAWKTVAKLQTHTVDMDLDIFGQQSMGMSR